VLQEYLQPDSEEYAVGVYSTKDRCQVGAIAMLRLHMVGQHSYKIRVLHHGPAQAEAQAVAAAIGVVGPCKVQMFMTGRGPVTYEIHPGFAPTTAMRAHFGFNEVEMAVRDLVLDEPVPQPRVRTGVALRFWEEVYVNDQANNSAREGATDQLTVPIQGAS
jgi:carbamoyl-phosphate synthase large subunit